MSARKPKVATKKQLLESIASLQMHLTAEQELRSKQYNSMREAEQKLKKFEQSQYELESTVESLKGRCHKLELDLAEEDARAEAFEFVLRLQNGAKVTEPPLRQPQGLAISPDYDAFRSPR